MECGQQLYYTVEPLPDEGSIADLSVGSPFHPHVSKEVKLCNNLNHLSIGSLISLDFFHKEAYFN